METLDKVALLRQQAIDLLLLDREIIDEQLNQLGYGKENAPAQKRRGRKPKQSAEHQLSPGGNSLAVQM
jgi:hypothetical protein